MTLSALWWFGGKAHLLDQILPLPEHEIYVEVFGGGASLLLNKPASQMEVYNDINGRLVNFWKILKTRSQEFIDTSLDWGDLWSRDRFELSKLPDCNPMMDAVKFYYCNQHSFSGDNKSFGGFGAQLFSQSQRVYLNKLISTIPDIYQRIKYVDFENCDFRTLIKRSDRPNALLYIDPPYFQGGYRYEEMIGNNSNWSQEDLNDLVELCNHLQHAKVIVSYDVQETFAQLPFCKPILRTNSVYKGNRQKNIEYLFYNYDPAKVVSAWKKQQHAITRFFT